MKFNTKICLCNKRTFQPSHLAAMTTDQNLPLESSCKQTIAIDSYCSQGMALGQKMMKGHFQD